MSELPEGIATAATNALLRSPQVIPELLRNFGWFTEFRHLSSPFERWSNDRLNETILVPTDQSKPDYFELLRRAVNTLGAEHGSEVFDAISVLSMRNRALLDATKWSKETPVDAGLISWEIGEEIFAAARGSLVAAAKAAHRKRRYFGNSSSFVARRFLENTFMGQTEVGSFVVTAYTQSDRSFYFSKSGEESSASKMLDPEATSGGKIMDIFSDVIENARGKLDEYKNTPRDEVFDEIVPLGFSYEMANALSLLVKGSDGEVKVSRMNSASGGTAEKSTSFDAEESQVLERVARRLSDTREPEEVRLVGEIIRLEHASSVGEHTVRIHVANRPGTSSVRVRLSAEQYEQAIEAHRDELPFQVIGTMVRENNANWVRDPNSVNVLPRPEQPDSEEASRSPIPRKPESAQASLFDDDEPAG